MGDDVRIGSTQLFEGGELRHIKREVPHPDMDFALVELDEPATSSPIRIADEVGPDGTMTRILGWGSTQPDGGGPVPTTLQELDTSVVPDAECSVDGVQDPDHEFCTDSPGGTSGACFGDSGGPQVKQVDGVWELVGATSRGPDTCASAGTVYMAVPTFAAWIHEVAGGDAGRPAAPGTVTSAGALVP